MKKTWIFWILAFIITLSAAYYQRITGPTYPKRCKIQTGNEIVKFKLIRSSDTGKDLAINIPAVGKEASGYLYYKRFNTPDKWTILEMKNHSDTLTASMPSQPAAGKLQYIVRLKLHPNDKLETEPPVVVRFKGSVPMWVLIPHIFFMFLAMFFSNFTGLLAIGRGAKQKKWALITLLVMIIGGLFLGPVVQKFAFGELWTGVPFGWDLTDNKTLIGFTGWLFAVGANWNKERRGWIIFAAILTLVVYSIPHSMFGSQLDYNTGVIKQG
ncbi:MAG: hypothetical protein HY951_04930 [Bacteroidia bacterium]|nr:hypothetical protein [Bacteroidia bacterium]